MRSLVVVGAVLAMFVVAASASNAHFEMAQEAMTELGSHAALISRINKVAAQMRVEQMRTGVKGYFCKTIYKTDSHKFPYSSQFLESKYGSWLPETQKSATIFLQGEAAAKAFVGIGAAIGVGLDITVDVSHTPHQATGEVRLFACIGFSMSVGFIGAQASAGGGVLVGFGTFKESINKANLEISADVGALGSGGVGLMVNVKGGADAFRETWTNYQTRELGPFVANREYAQKCWDWFKRLAKSGLAALKASVVGVHVSGGVGVGGGVGASAELDGADIIEGIKRGFKALWNTAPAKWLKTTKGWAKLQGGLSKLKEKAKGSKLYQKTKGIANKALDIADDFFDYVPIRDEDVEDAPDHPPLQRSNGQRDLKAPGRK